MKENLAGDELARGRAPLPVLLGGAALTRAYVEHDLGEVYDGDVSLRPRRLRGPAAHGRAHGGQARAARRCRRRRRARAPRTRASSVRATAPYGPPRSTSRRCRPAPTSRPTYPCPTPPFCGSRVVKGIALADYAAVPRRARDVHGPVGAARRARRQGSVVRGAGRDRGPAAAARRGCDRIQSEGIMNAAVVYGYFPCVSKGDDLIVLTEDGARAAAASPSRGSAATGTCACPTSSGPRSPARPTSSPSTS